MSSAYDGGLKLTKYGGALSVFIFFPLRKNTTSFRLESLPFEFIDTKRAPIEEPRVILASELKILLTEGFNIKFIPISSLSLDTTSTLC